MRHGLPIRAPGVDADAVRAAMRGDKKRAAGRPRMVLLGAVGHPVWGIDPGDGPLDAAVERGRRCGRRASRSRGRAEELGRVLRSCALPFERFVVICSNCVGRQTVFARGSADEGIRGTTATELGNAADATALESWELRPGTSMQ